MSSPAAKEKAELRSRARLRLKVLSEADRLTASIQIRARLAQHDIWRNANRILLYRPMLTEPDILPLLEPALAERKRIAFPRFHPEQNGYLPHLIRGPEDLVEGPFGIPEPSENCESVALNQLDLALVPGLWFDTVGHRLGRGKGYYDRMLRAASGTLCGIAFEWQVLDALPVEPHDVQLSCILTPTRWRDFRQAARGY